MCEHLDPVESYLIRLGRKSKALSQASIAEARNEMLYNCVLDPEALITRFALPEYVEAFEALDTPAGEESGLICHVCHEAIAGAHPYGRYAEGLPLIG